MSAVWPLPDDVRHPDWPTEYRADDVDEMTAGSLAVLAAIRRRLEDALVWDAAATRRVTTVVDEYAREIRDNARDRGEDDFDDDPDAFPTMLAEAARRRFTA